MVLSDRTAITYPHTGKSKFDHHHFQVVVVHLSNTQKPSRCVPHPDRNTSVVSIKEGGRWVEGNTGLIFSHQVREDRIAGGTCRVYSYEWSNLNSLRNQSQSILICSMANHRIQTIVAMKHSRQWTRIAGITLLAETEMNQGGLLWNFYTVHAHVCATNFPWTLCVCLEGQAYAHKSCISWKISTVLP